MRVYIAGPISLGDRVANIRQAILAADLVLRAGHTPFVPHLDFLWELVVGDAPYEGRMAYDHEWIKVCGALIRLPGASSGADREVVWARELGIPVYFSVDDFLAAAHT